MLAKDISLLCYSPLNVTLFVRKEDISLHARIKISACQRDCRSSKHRPIVRTDCCYARLLIAQRLHILSFSDVTLHNAHTAISTNKKQSQKSFKTVLNA